MPNIIDVLLEAQKRGVKQAEETSIRTGTPLIVYENGKIVRLKPKYKYVRVSIKAEKKRKTISKEK